ncbi:MAG: bifunctional serine/threonine-protein kinase/formylglycine-generating enzyme family protein [Planctomycetota bacterium]|nr:bifunctional serine/threonine-protein kinase/formylglycine-generating enzyme family protein [Planctomycetota bacterium]
MAITLDKFMTHVADSSLLSAAEVHALIATLPENRRPADGEQLARELVRQKKLTAYQAQQVYAGKGKSLVLGNYVVLDKLGQGGMGLVLKAEHRRMKRLVALKVLSPKVRLTPEALRRFQREVEAAAKLEHANIVTAHDADEAGGTHFLVMQYVEGIDLAALVKEQGPLPVGQALDCILQAARGLQYAHEHGVVHRDIKPANLLLDRQGTVKILDMGLARLESAGAEQDQLTGTGQIMGTVDYMAPEQALDTKHADARADIYSLGITLWYLLTGRAVYGGETLMAKLLAHREASIPSLREACPQVSAELDGVFAKMLAKTPDTRYQTMAEVIADLHRCQTGQPLVSMMASTVGTARDEGSPLDVMLRSMESSGGLAVAAKVAPKKTVALSGLEPTGAWQSPQVATDTETQQSLVSPLASRAVASRQARSPWWQKLRLLPQRRVLVAGAVVGTSLLLAGIVLLLQTKQGTVRIEINDPAVEVLVDGEGATIKGAQPQEIKLEPGQHGLRIKYGPLDFETDKFILSRGDTITLKVELLPASVQVVKGDTPLGARPLPAIAPFKAQQARDYQEAWAKHLDVPVEYANTLGMQFILIPPGEFTMGSTPTEIEEALKVAGDNKDWQEKIKSEAPQHKVILTQPIYLGIHEVTQAQYEKVMGKNPSHFAATGPGKDAVAGVDTSTHPVEMVNWNDAVEFCAKLSAKEKLKPFKFELRAGETVRSEGTGYRLPTEAEWEFACRAGTTTKYWIGDTERDLRQAGWFNANSGGRTHAVGELKANPFGLFDIHGNVWEWLQDWWDPTYYGQFQEKPALNPGPLNGPSSAGSRRMVRGGGWGLHPSRCRASYRHADDPPGRYDNPGFRVALVVGVPRVGRP